MNKKQENIDEVLLLKIIENRADDMELTIFQEWQNESEENAAFFAQMKKTYQLSSFDKHSTKANWEKVVNKVRTGCTVPDFIELTEPREAGKHIRLKTLLRVAAVITLTIGLSFLLKNIVFSHEELILSGSELKNNEAYQMADGSLVYLHGNSEISFQKKFGKKNRKVNLKGEAFFEVQKNENSPFVITSNNTKTKVLGTSFNVLSNSSGEVKVSVVTGVVEFFTDKKNNVVLHANEQGNYNPVTNEIEKVHINNPNFIAWKTGTIFFRDTPLMDAFETLGKHYSKVLLFKGEEGTASKITTTFDNQSFEAVLEELNLLLNAKNVLKNDTVIFEFNHQ